MAPYVVPGMSTSLAFTGTPTVKIKLRQDPALLLIMILTAVFDVVVGQVPGVQQLSGSIDKLGCAADVVEAALSKSMSEQVAGTFRGFFSCVGPILESLAREGAKVKNFPIVSIVVAILASGPGFLVTSAIGLINEFTGASKATIELEPQLPQTRATPRKQQKVAGFADAPCRESGAPRECRSPTTTRSTTTPASVSSR